MENKSDESPFLVSNTEPVELETGNFPFIGKEIPYYVPKTSEQHLPDPFKRPLVPNTRIHSNPVHRRLNIASRTAPYTLARHIYTHVPSSNTNLENKAICSHEMFSYIDQQKQSMPQHGKTHSPNLDEYPNIQPQGTQSQFYFSELLRDMSLKISSESATHILPHHTTESPKDAIMHSKSIQDRQIDCSMPPGKSFFSMMLPEKILTPGFRFFEIATIRDENGLHLNTLITVKPLVHESEFTPMVLSNSFNSFLFINTTIWDGIVTHSACINVSRVHLNTVQFAEYYPANSVWGNIHHRPQDILTLKFNISIFHIEYDDDCDRFPNLVLSLQMMYIIQLQLRPVFIGKSLDRSHIFRYMRNDGERAFYVLYKVDTEEGKSIIRENFKGIDIMPET